MKTFKKLGFTLIVLFIYQTAYSQTIDEYIKEAESYNQSGDLEQAAEVMETAIQKYPNSSDAHSYLGLYRGSQAGGTQDFMEAGRLIGIAYEMLDKAVLLDPDNPTARFHRGVMGIEVPAFLNKLDQGIQDLEFLSRIHEKSPDKVSPEILADAYSFLGEGYGKKQENQKAIAAWENVIRLAPETTLAKSAQKNISNLTKPEEIKTDEQKKYNLADLNKFKQQVDKEPDNPKLLVQLGKAYIDTNHSEEAENVLRKAIQNDSANVDAYILLIQAIGSADKGYDERIYEDTDFRSNIAFEIANLAEKAVEIAPDNMKLRLIRGSIGVMMPFFVGKLEQAIEDLNLVRESNLSDNSKAEALYWLGAAYQKKAMTHWIEVITDYSETDASKEAFVSMHPSVRHFEPAEYQRPFLVIDFILGFRDELPPQTVVWIEDRDGRHIKTLYVSGFSGFAKEKQVNLSEWAESSKFRDVDAVTAASIDIGHHIYVWDLKDYEGNIVETEEYIVKVETAYWPSLEYQLVSANIMTGKNDSRIVVEEGNLIPYLEVKYYSENN